MPQTRKRAVNENAECVHKTSVIRKKSGTESVVNGQPEAIRKSTRRKSTFKSEVQGIEETVVTAPSGSANSRNRKRCYGKNVKQSNNEPINDTVIEDVKKLDPDKKETHKTSRRKDAKQTKACVNVDLKENAAKSKRKSLRSSKKVESNEKDENVNVTPIGKCMDDESSDALIKVEMVSARDAEPVEFMSSSDDDSEFEIEQKKPCLSASKRSNDSVITTVEGKELQQKKSVERLDDSSSDDEFMHDTMVTNNSNKKNGKVRQNKKLNLKVEDVSTSTRKRRKKLDVSIDQKKNDTHGKKNDEKVQTAKKQKLESISKVDQEDVTAVLLHMEGRSSKGENSVAGTLSGSLEDSSFESDDEDMASSDGEGDWEEVEDHQLQKSPKKNQLPDSAVEITLDAPQFLKKRKKKVFDWKAYFVRKMNRFKKDLREDIHKVHLLCLLSQGMYLTRLCNDEDLQCHALSLVPPEFTGKSGKKFTSSLLLKVTQWFKSKFKVNSDLTDESNGTPRHKMIDRLQKRCEHQEVSSMLEFVLLFIILLRSLGLEVRLTMSLQPLNLKPVKIEAGNKSQGKKSKTTDDKMLDKKSNTTDDKMLDKKSKTTDDKMLDKKSKTTDDKMLDIKSKSSKKTNNKVKQSTTSNLEEQVNSQESKSGYFNESEQTSDKSSRYFERKKKDKQSQKKETDVEQGGKYRIKSKTLRSRGSKVKPSSYKQESESDLEDSDEDDFVPVSDNEEDEDEKGRKKTKKKGGNKNLSRKGSHIVNSSSSEFEEDLTQYRSPTSNKPLKFNKKILSDSEESFNGERMPMGCDQWPEVFLELENKWICVNCVKGELNSANAIESHATQPLHYAVAFDSEEHVKDVTPRYASKWLTDTRKIRVDPDWWDETLSPYKIPDTRRNQLEDQAIQDGLVKRPMPTSIGAFKSHPLYVLKRHLLKFEAIYPNSAVPVGYIRGEPVYARDCVHVLHSRENWLKEGRVVRVGEEPYKMVKSRPKWKKPKLDPDALDLECFGHWQTDIYVPPPAVNGKVPRNEYGNIELFMPSMLPAGTVHLKVPGLNKVARKLKLDCVPAMTGWDTHCGYSHPVMDGFVVCEEHKDILLAAWDEDQELQREREEEKREKRVYGNWKTLIKSLLIKEKLKRRFDLQNKDMKEDFKPSGDTPAEKVQDYEMSWPRQETNQQKLKGKKKSKFSQVETL